MKKLIIIFTLIIPFNLYSQNWTDEEKEILEKVKIGWQSWEEAVNQNDRSIWLEKTNPSDNLVVWATSNSFLSTTDGAERRFELYMKDKLSYYWINVTPLKIQVSGEVGYIWFHASSVIQKKGGELVKDEQKRFEVYRKINGEWRWEAGMVDK